MIDARKTKTQLINELEQLRADIEKYQAISGDSVSILQFVVAAFRNRIQMIGNRIERFYAPFSFYHETHERIIHPYDDII